MSTLREAIGSGTFTQASASPGLRGSSSRMTRHPFVPELLRLPHPVARRRQPPTATRNSSELRQQLHHPLRRCSLRCREPQRWHRVNSRARRQFGVQSHCPCGLRAGTGVHTHTAGGADGRSARNRADTAVHLQPRPSSGGVRRAPQLAPRTAFLVRRLRAGFRRTGVPNPLGVRGHLGPHENAVIPQQLQTRETQISLRERRLRPPEVALFARNRGRVARAMPGDLGVVQGCPLLQMPARDRPFVPAAVDEDVYKLLRAEVLTTVDVHSQAYGDKGAALLGPHNPSPDGGSLPPPPRGVTGRDATQSGVALEVPGRQAARRPTCSIANRVQVRFEK